MTGNDSQDKILGSIEDDEKVELERQARMPASSEPSKTTVIVMDGSAGYDPAAEDKIGQLAVPESVRQEILSNYRRTGIMPAFEQK